MNGPLVDQFVTQAGHNGHTPVWACSRGAAARRLVAARAELAPAAGLRPRLPAAFGRPALAWRPSDVDCKMAERLAGAVFRELVQLTTLDEEHRTRSACAHTRRARGDSGPAGRPRAAHRARADGHRGHRLQHREEDPRVLPHRHDREGGRAAQEVPAGVRGADAHPGPRPQDAAEAARRARRHERGDARGRDRRQALRTVPGLGAKMEEKILHAIARMGGPARRSACPPTARCRSRASWWRPSRRCRPSCGRSTAAACGACARRWPTSTSSPPRPTRPPCARRSSRCPAVSEVIGSGDTQDVDPDRDRAAGGPADRRARAVRRRLPVLHGLEGAQHQAPPARASTAGGR